MAELESLKTDNPTIYPSRCFVKLGLAFIYLLIAVARILMLVLNKDFCLLYHPNSLYCKETQTSSWNNWIYILLADILLNLWPLSWLFSMSIGPRNKEKIVKFSWLALFKSFAFYFFLLDIALMIAIPILQRETGNHIRIQMIIVIFTLIPCGAAYFYLINNFHILSYDPNLNCSTLAFDKEYTESESRTWYIKESGTFRIVLQNSGDEVVKAGNEYLVERIVNWRGIHGNGGNVTLNTTVRFPLKIETDLEIGETAVLIPETHTEPGAVQIDGFRSFGNVKGNTIWTSIYSKDKSVLAKMVQEYTATEAKIEPTYDRDEEMESPPVIKLNEEEEWKPVKTAKRRRNRIPMNQMSKNKKCAICGDVPTGYHYTVLSCNGCKTFFRRTVTTRRQFICSRGGKCEFSKEFRCSCRACRFKKCVKAGMDPKVLGSEDPEFELPLFSVESPVRMKELEQIGVLSVVAHREKTLQSLRSENLPLSFCPDYRLEELLGSQCNIGRNMPLKDDNTVCETYKLNPVRYWMIVDLFLTVEFAKTFVEFQNLNTRDKLELLYSVGASLQIFSQSYYSFAAKSDSVVFPDGTNALNHQIVQRNRPQHEAYYRNAYCRPVGIISQLGFTQGEFAMFKAIALFSSGSNTLFSITDDSEGDLSQSSQEIVRRKRAELILVFRKHLVKEYGSQMGIEKLACALYAISTFIDIAEKRRAYVFCMDLTEKCNFPNLVQGIYLKRKVT